MPEATVTIEWVDENKDPVSFDVTAFGNAEGSTRMMVFYNDNISEAPVYIANEEQILGVDVSPLGEPLDGDEEEAVEVEIAEANK